MTTTARPPSRPWHCKLTLWAVLLLVLITGVAALIGWRMSFVPADLDLATRQTTQGGHFEVAYAPADLDGRVPVNRLHAWTLTVTTPDGGPVEGAQIAVDGDMPQHGHGLPTQPEVTRDFGVGRYLVEGVKFQMGGWWVVDATITAGSVTDTVRFNLRLE